MKGLSTLKKIGKAAAIFAIGIAGTLITDKASDKLVSGIKNYKKDDEEDSTIDVNEFVEDDSEDEAEEETEETED